ncbi:MAG: type II secretion system GspH family protein [Candidatus Omnitrophica bacterium]|nr:type II secretion system GspH family protein [Candidatus Omnitrophota bacterium]
MNEKGFSLLELIIIGVILIALVSMATPVFLKTRERALDREAVANLKLIIAAEKIYRMEIKDYYFSSNITDLNTNLKLTLPSGPNRAWNYSTVGSNVGGGVCAQADRVGGIKTWRMRLNEDNPHENSTCP